MTATEHVIRWSTAGAVVGVAAVAAVASYEHAYALVRAHGEAGWTGRLRLEGDCSAQVAADPRGQRSSMLIKLEHADRALWLPGDRERRLVGLCGVDLTYISVRPLNGCR